MIDRIEFSVEQSTDYVRGARAKLKRGEELQRAARKVAKYVRKLLS